MLALGAGGDILNIFLFYKITDTDFNIYPSVLKLNWNSFKRSTSAFIASLLNEGQFLMKIICPKNGGINS